MSAVFAMKKSASDNCPFAKTNFASLNKWILHKHERNNPAYLSVRQDMWYKQDLVYPEWEASLPGVNITHRLNKSHSANVPKTPCREGQYITRGTLLHLFHNPNLEGHI